MGNAFPPPVAKAIGEAIFFALLQDNKKRGFIEGKLEIIHKIMGKRESISYKLKENMPNEI